MSEKWMELKIKTSPGNVPEREMKIKASDHRNAVAFFLVKVDSEVNDIMIEDKTNIFRYDNLRTSFEDLDSLIKNPDNIQATLIE